jgi:hypothetical protein
VRRDHLNAVVAQLLIQRIAVTGAIADQFSGLACRLRPVPDM